MKVSTLLKKEKEGTLYKYTKEGEEKVALGVIPPPTPLSGMVGSPQQQHQKQQQPSLPSTPTVKTPPAANFTPSVTAPSAPKPPSVPRAGGVKLSWDRVTGIADELYKLGAISFEQATSLLKVAEEREITREEAETALRKIRRLEKTKPTSSEMLRGAGVGAVVGPLMTMAYRTIAGKKVRPLSNKAWFPGVRPLVASSGSTAVMGGLMPAFRHKLEREAEKSTLQGYLEEHRRKSELTGQIKKVLQENK